MRKIWRHNAVGLEDEKQREAQAEGVSTLFITPVIYLYLDRFSGKGPPKFEADQELGSGKN